MRWRIMVLVDDFIQVFRCCWQCRSVRCRNVELTASDDQQANTADQPRTWLWTSAKSATAAAQNSGAGPRLTTVNTTACDADARLENVLPTHQIVASSLDGWGSPGQRRRSKWTTGDSSWNVRNCWSSVISIGISLKELVVRCRNVWNFAQGLKFKADFHSNMSVCWHELWGGIDPPTSHRQFQHWA